MPRALTAPSLRRTMLLIVAVALLLSQALGLLHGVVHAPQAPNALQALSSPQATGSLQALQPTQTLRPPQNLPSLSAARAAQQLSAVFAHHADSAEHGTAGGADGHWLDRLFAAHDTNACASYDQLAHADFLWGQPPDLCATAVTTAASAFHPAWHIAAQAAGYLARGPPRLA